MAKQKMVWLFLLGLVLLVFSQMAGVSREAIPTFDGIIDQFMIRIVDNSEEAIVGDLYSVDLNVKNLKSTNGTMYVQCSILDKNQHNWLNEVGRSSFMRVTQNCQPGEPYTQTAQIQLAGDEQKMFTFEFKVPDTPNGKNVIYCSAYERCWAQGIDPYESYAVVKDVAIESEPTVGPTTPNANTKADTCKETNECSGWLLGARCMNGHCVDKEDAPSSFEWPELDGEGFKASLSKYKTQLGIFGFLLLFVAIFVGYKQKRNGFQ